MEVRAWEAEGKPGHWCSPPEKWNPKVCSGTRRNRGRTMEVGVPAEDRGEMGVLGKGQTDFTWEKGGMREMAEGKNL